MFSNKITLNIIIKLLIVSLFCFIISGFLFKGSLNDTSSLSKEIFSPSEALYEYNITSNEPFKFRVLFSSLVEITYKVFSEPQNSQKFYAIYVFWSGFFYISAVLSFYFLLKTLGFKNHYSLTGTMLFLLNPAIIFAFSLPVHTREDLMAYTILNIGLICIVRNNNVGILVFSILGVLCRETLLLLPLIFLLYGKANILYKGGVFLLSLLTFFTIRVTLQSEGYDLIGLGLMYNLENMEEVIGFFFLVFNFTWPAFFLDIYYINVSKGKTLGNDAIALLRKSSLLVFILVVISTFIGGRVNEIRLLFILFPWVIAIFLYYLQHGLGQLIKNAITRKYKIYAFSMGIPCLLLFIIVYFNIHLFLRGVHDVPYIQWITITCIYLYLFFLLMPIYIALIKKRPLSLNKEIFN